MPRTAGKRGKRPAAPLPLLPIGAYLHEPLPAPVYPVDVTGGIAPDTWQMLGNGPDPSCTVRPDGVGDCTYACRQHVRYAKAAAFGETETWETANQLVKEYLKYDGGQDKGAVISSLLLAWYRARVILAFAPVDHTDRAQCDAAMAKFHGLYLGGDLTDDADLRFENHEPWSVAAGQRPDPSEGHCFLRVKSTGAGPAATSTNVTWGAEQESTAAWDRACISEAYVLVTREDELEPGELAALRADIDALGGVGDEAAPKAAAGPGPLHEFAQLVSKAIDWLHAKGL